MRLTAARTARQATQDRQAQRQLDEQERAARANARTGWAPAHDARWLAQADVHQAFRTWGAAVPWADTDPVAASAMRKSEERLRTLHPFAMARYDRLCAEGAGPIEAMRKAVRLFGYHPNARPGGHRPVQGIEAPADSTPSRPSVTAPSPGRYQNRTSTRTLSAAGGGSPNGCKPRRCTSAGQNSPRTSWSLRWNRRPACPPR